MKVAQQLVSEVISLLKDSPEALEEELIQLGAEAERLNQPELATQISDLCQDINTLNRDLKEMLN